MDNARFHQLDVSAFNDRISGAVPTAADRTKFTKPEIGDRNMKKWAICAELTWTIKSVLDAAESDHGLEVLCTPYPKAKGDLGKLEDSINHVGIYPATEAAQRATKLAKEDIPSSKVVEDDLRQGRIGRCSWFWLSLLGEVKSLNSGVCAFSMDPGSPHQTTSEISDDSPDPLSSSLSTDSEDEVGTTLTTSSSTSAALPEVRAGDHPCINATPGGEQGFYQLTDHMSKLFACQHRLFAYGFYVQWKWARLLYFDRSGALVSEPFDWTATTSPLHDFVWKVAHMTPEQLGYDPTAELASESDMKMLRSKMQDQSLPAEVRQYVRNAFLQSEATTSTQETTATRQPEPELPLDNFPIHRLTVTSSDPSPDDAFPNTSVPSPSNVSSSGVQRTFLAGRPHFLSDGLVGRCTRGYIAFDLQDEVFCFLKDSWRPLTLTSTHSCPEHLVYERLHRHGVAHTASLICGGDVGGHRAQLTLVQEDMPMGKKHVPRVHYRIVVKEVGVPLTEFKTFTELARVFQHALLAHKGAWEQAGILHHDINLGNILIDPGSRSGILIDWDLSRLASELEYGPVEPNRTGTWQFRSALVLYYPRKPYRLSDDIESFIHAFRYLVLRFHPTEIWGIRYFAETYFEHSVHIKGVKLGGQTKMVHFRSEQSPFGVVYHPALQALLGAIARRCYREFYKLVDCDLMARKYGVDIHQQTNAPEKVAQRQKMATPNPRRVNFKASPMFGKFKHLDNVRPPSPPREVLAKVDACDIEEGFLSHHSHLLEFFALFCGATEELDKYEDQFVARAAEEPVRMPYYEPIRGSSDDSGMSGSQSQESMQDSDLRVSGTGSVRAVTPPPSLASAALPYSSAGSTGPPPGDLSCVFHSKAIAQITSLEAPSAAPSDVPSAPSAPSTSSQILRKRKQMDIQVYGDAVAGHDGSHGEEEETPNPKRRQVTAP